MTIRVIAGASQRDLTDLKLPGGIVAFMDDLATSAHPSAPITSGLFRMGRGEALAYDYTFDEFKLLLEGDMAVTAEDGTVHELKAGDLIQFSAGDKVMFSSRTSGLAFYVAQR